MHIRATARTGASEDDIREALLHVAIYAGVPAANTPSRLPSRSSPAWRRRRRNEPRKPPNAAPETGPFFGARPRSGIRRPSPPYKTTVLRSPQRRSSRFDNTISEITGPAFGHGILGELDNDLIHNFAKPGESAIGPRIIVHGRVLDERGRPVPNVLIEFWQANAGGRYRHKKEGYLAALDPNFGGCGRAISAADGSYSASARSSPAPIPGRTASTTGGRRTSTSRCSAPASPSA